MASILGKDKGILGSNNSLLGAAAEGQMPISQEGSEIGAEGMAQEPTEGMEQGEEGFVQAMNAIEVLQAGIKSFLDQNINIEGQSISNPEAVDSFINDLNTLVQKYVGTAS